MAIVLYEIFGVLIAQNIQDFPKINIEPIIAQVAKDVRRLSYLTLSLWGKIY